MWQGKSNRKIDYHISRNISPIRKPKIIIILNELFSLSPMSDQDIPQMKSAGILLGNWMPIPGKTATGIPSEDYYR